MSAIKQRRLSIHDVKCHADTKVGQYVPFYFCPRSIMLYILSCGNHPDITYRDGQDKILHLEADLQRVVDWAGSLKRRWAFSDRNASSYIAGFYNDVKELSRINWSAVESTDFRNSDVKEGKQAEFLVFLSFPWKLIEKVGVIDETAQAKVKRLLDSKHQPEVEVEKTWYF